MNSWSRVQFPYGPVQGIAGNGLVGYAGATALGMFSRPPALLGTDF
jgi:hypothetical protein